MKPEEKKLTAKEQRFVDEYCIDCNAKCAAIRAGYSERSAKEIGYENLTKPHLRAAIEVKLKTLSLSAGETTKLIVDIAKGNLNQYLKVEKRERTPQLRVPLQKAIDKLLEEIEFEAEFATLAGYSEDEIKIHEVRQAGRQREVIRLRLRLQKYPLATTLIDGEPETIEVAEVDLVALAKDKEAGRIKSLKQTEYGLQAELYPADAALRDVARMHGLFEKDNDQLKPIIPTTLQVEVVQPKEED